MTKLDKIIDFIRDPNYMVFWCGGDGGIKELVRVDDNGGDEIQAFFNYGFGEYVDLYNVDFGDIRVFEELEITK